MGIRGEPVAPTGSNSKETPEESPAGAASPSRVYAGRAAESDSSEASGQEGQGQGCEVIYAEPQTYDRRRVPRRPPAASDYGNGSDFAPDLGEEEARENCAGVEEGNSGVLSRSIHAVAATTSDRSTAAKGARVKGDKGDRVTVSVWTRNLQMSAWGLCFACCTGALQRDFRSRLLDPARGVTFGFTPTVWAAVTNQVLGGIVVALVIRQTSNVAKNFVTSVAIVVNAGASYLVWGDRLSIWFALGAGLVSVSTVGYAVGSPYAGRDGDKEVLRTTSRGMAVS